LICGTLLLITEIGGTIMDLKTANLANIQTMLEGIKDKLQLVNRDVLKAEAISFDRYEDLYALYQMIMKKPSFSVLEREGILDELRALRK
jgi:uncharacterized protein YfkK (UPF0435 family)